VFCIDVRELTGNEQAPSWWVYLLVSVFGTATIMALVYVGKYLWKHRKKGAAAKIEKLGLSDQRAEGSRDLLWMFKIVYQRVGAKVKYVFYKLTGEEKKVKAKVAVEKMEDKKKKEAEAKKKAASGLLAMKAMKAEEQVLQQFAAAQM
jgi:hypothetical protein